jgi:hypothetical protein
METYWAQASRSGDEGCRQEMFWNRRTLSPERY